MHDKIVILDFGSQYTQLIAKRIRQLDTFCTIYPYNKKDFITPDVKGIILSGSPFSVNDPNSPFIDTRLLINSDVPILGICYGAQLLASQHGGEVVDSDKREYGKALLQFQQDDVLFRNIDNNSQVWMSHGDSILTLPENSQALANTGSIPFAAFKLSDSTEKRSVYGLQFHPEVYHSEQGQGILKNFLFEICKVKADWTPNAFVKETIHGLKKQIGDDEVCLGLSGGVDSSVTAMLLHRAIGRSLKCFFINNGLLRKNEFENVLKTYENMGLNISGVEATQTFLDQLKGVSDPELKRKIIGRAFIEVFEKETKKSPNIKWLGQGTIYPDVIESVSVHGPSVTIKSHHNVGGLPERMKLKLVEPLRMLFKDEVRNVGAVLGLKPEILNRHPFPGPGLAIRVLGEITDEKLHLCREADSIFIDILQVTGWYDKVWQAGAILLPVQSVGVMGDQRTYEYTIALRCVNSVDGMTAQWSSIPYDILGEISNEIINKVKGINRVVYDISTKPPATIEWE